MIVCQLEKNDGVLTENDVDAVNVLAEYFKSVFVDEDTSTFQISSTEQINAWVTFQHKITITNYIGNPQFSVIEEGSLSVKEEGPLQSN